MTDRIIWHNGDLAPASEGRIQPEDRGLLFGEGAFETLRVYGGRPFRLDAHLERLASALRVMEISVPELAERLRQGVDDTLAANALADSWVRITITAGAEDGVPNLIVAAMPLPELPASWYASGVAVATATSRFVREPASVLSGLKSTNYLASRLARKEAQARGAHEAIFLNTHGRLAEGASSNIFLVEDGALITPSAALVTWHDPQGRRKVLDGGKLEIDGLVRSQVKFAGAADEVPQGSQAVRWQAPLRSIDPPGIDPKRLVVPGRPRS